MVEVNVVLLAIALEEEENNHGNQKAKRKIWIVTTKGSDRIR